MAAPVTCSIKRDAGSLDRRLTAITTRREPIANEHLLVRFSHRTVRLREGVGYHERSTMIRRSTQRSLIATMFVVAMVGALATTPDAANAADSLTASDKQAVMSFADDYEAAFASASADPKSASSLLAPVADKKLIAILKKDYFSRLVKDKQFFKRRSIQIPSRAVQSGSTSSGTAKVVWCGVSIDDFYYQGELSDSGTNVVETTAEVRKSGRRWLMTGFDLASNSSCANSLDQPASRPDILAVPARYQSTVNEAQKNPGAAALLLPAAFASPALEKQLAAYREMANKGQKWIGTDDDTAALNPHIDDAIVLDKGVVRVTFCYVTGGYVVDKNGKKIPETIGIGADELTLSVAKFDRAWKVIAVRSLNTKPGKSDCNVPGGKPKKK